jgi:hypothetical protein
MRIKNPDNYVLAEFQISNTLHKKYDAILVNKMTLRSKRVPFGYIRYSHYRDRTPLRYYSYLDHNDLNRRHRYLTRTDKNNDFKYSSAWFSKHYLW